MSEEIFMYTLFTSMTFFPYPTYGMDGRDVFPLFTLGCDKVACIDFPPAALPVNLKKKAKWLNFYDSDDVLAWPLKPLSIHYADTVSEDIEVSVGNILTAWNPANHAAYWTDDSVIKPASHLIATVLEETQRQSVAPG